MTQFKVGAQQSLPRGESQVIAAKRFDAADKEFVLRAPRNAGLLSDFYRLVRRLFCPAATVAFDTENRENAASDCCQRSLFRQRQ